MSASTRVDRLDMSLFDEIREGGASSSDRRSLLALHAALASRGEFSYLEVGSFHGASLQSFIVDPRCHRIVSIDRRDAASPDERRTEIRYPDNTTARMLHRLAAVPGADLSKLTTIDAGTRDVDPTGISADLCFIDAEHTKDAALQDARFCRWAIRDRGVIVFHDRILIDQGIRQFLGELPRFRAYPLAHDLFVVEINVPSLFTDSRVRAQLPRRVWLIGERLRVIRAVLGLAPQVRRFRRRLAQSALIAGAPRRRGHRLSEPRVAWGEPVSRLFEIHTFVNDESLYERMRASFIDVGFGPEAFVRQAGASDNPYAAITRIGSEAKARYPIVCREDVIADQGAGAAELAALLEQLDTADPDWVVAGSAGVTGSGRLLRRLIDGHWGSTSENLPLPVVNLDESVLVLNPRNGPHCSAGVSGFHLYGADVCLHALASGGSAYVIDLPLTRMGSDHTSGDHWRRDSREYERVRDTFSAVWNDRCLFRYVLTPNDALFLSRSRILRRLFGSPRAVAAVAQCREQLQGVPLRPIDRIAASRLRRTRAAPASS